MKVIAHFAIKMFTFLSNDDSLDWKNYQMDHEGRQFSVDVGNGNSKVND